VNFATYQIVRNSEGGEMKAWKVYHKLAPEEAELVFANTRAQAIHVEIKEGNYDLWQGDWPDMRAIRRKDLDGFNRHDTPYVEDDNIPSAPEFYSDEY